MTISFRSITTATDTGVSATVSVTTSESPQATQIGDLVLFFYDNDFYAIANMGTPSVTGSPTLNAIAAATADDTAAGSHSKAFWYVANTAGAQTISATETGTHDEDKGLAVYVMAGADTSSPVDDASNTVQSTSSPTSVATGVTPSTSTAMLFCHLRTSRSSAGGGSWTPPGSMTERYDITNFTTLTGATEQLVASGATGTRTFTPAASAPFIASVVAIKAAASASGVEANWPVRLPANVLIALLGIKQLAQGTSFAVQLADASLTITATLTPSASLVKPVNSAPTLTATITPTAASTKPVDASLTASATITATASVVKPIDATLTVTDSITSSASLVKPFDATLTITDTISPTFVSTKPVDASLTVTATRTPAGLAIKPIDAALTETATITSAVSTTKPIDAVSNIVATITVGASVGGVDATKTFTTTITPAASTTKPVDAVASPIATITAAASAVKAMAVSLSGTATITATASITKAIDAGLSITATITVGATSGPSGVPPPPRIVSTSSTSRIASVSSTERVTLGSSTQKAVSTTQIGRQS